MYAQTLNLFIKVLKTFIESFNDFIKALDIVIFFNWNVLVNPVNLFSFDGVFDGVFHIICLFFDKFFLICFFEHVDW